MLHLVVLQLLKHPIRSLLTMGSLTVALFLLCLLTSLVTTLEAGVEAADSRRLWVQSAVSLFVDLPASYQPKIAAVPGVKRTAKWQWFGGYYQDPSNFFAQFAVDPEELFALWPELKVVGGTEEAFLRRRNSCVIGKGLAEQFGWKVGDTVPLIGALFPMPDGSAWEFEVAAVYEPTKATLDNRTLFFQWEYFEQTMREIEGETPNVGVFVIEVDRGADVTSIMGEVDRLFENGPQRVQTTTEAEFNRQFVSMVGNVPRLVSFIGAGVFFAILLACVNTMLMAAREQTRDVGILKSLGFTDATLFRYYIVQSLVLCGAGGGLGILFALASKPAISAFLGRYFPGYEVKPATVALAVGVTLLVGLLAGIVPARNAGRLDPVHALRHGG
jgi:putative ABC transport system permease protein